MEEINWLRVIAGMLLVLFLPGYTLIQAMFPRRGELDEEFDTLYRVTPVSYTHLRAHETLR